MLRAPVAGAFAHRPRPSDFLLVRSSAGALSVRRLTGSLVLGQAGAPDAHPCAQVQGVQVRG